MAKSPQKQSKKSPNNLGSTHILIFVTIAVVVFLATFFKIIPIGVSGFVVPLFQPSGEAIQKIGFVKFNGNVYASPKSITTFPEMGEKGRYITVNEEISKEKINAEFIFDFTFNPRTEEHNGYVKGSQEFYAKSPILGENAIILEPWIGFTILSAVISLVMGLLFTLILPTSVGFASVLFTRQIHETQTKIRLQTGFQEEVIDIITMPNSKFEALDKDVIEKLMRVVWMRTEDQEVGSAKQNAMVFDVEFDKGLSEFRKVLDTRIKEFFSDFVLKEIEDIRDGIEWSHNKFQIMKGLKLYMSHHFTERYANNVTGLAYGGAAVLIVAVGIRGLKFIPAAKPSFILFAIFLEFCLLALMAVTLVYTEEEERMDKMLKKMEDANRSQLETLKSQQVDMHRLSQALVGQTSEIIHHRVQEAIKEYMMSDDNIKRVVAEEISEKLMSALRETFRDKK
jgi:hypothetical protein